MPMPRSNLWRFVSVASIAFVLAVCAAVAYGVYQIISNPFRGDAWTLDEINGLFKVPVPQDATDLQYSGYTGLGAHLDLTFNAPPVAAEKFAQAICDGGLYAGYDPFHARNIAEPFTYTHPIEAGLFAYYSYSPDTPESVLGNRCGSQSQIRVDEADPSVYAVKAQVFFSCNAVCSPIRAKAIRPTDNFPFEILGLEQVGTVYLQTTSELCTGVRSNLTTFSEFNQKNLTGAQLEIRIDQRPVAAAVMDNDWGLTRRTDAQGNSVSVNISDNRRYYCFGVRQENGSHLIDLHLKISTGREISYVWKFSTGAASVPA